LSKWLFALGFLLVSAQGWTATLKGRIVSQDGRGVSGAKILVFNDLAAMMMLRSSSDRNGRYQFSIDPGHYRIFILKKGYQPINVKTLISHEQATFELNHDLSPELDVTENQNGDSLKRILRRTNRDREPNRDLVGLPLAQQNIRMQPLVDDSLQATVSTSTYQDLGGDVSHQETVHIKTRINSAVEVRSSFSQDRASRDPGARQIAAGVSLDLRHVQLDASASTIDSIDQQVLGRSRDVQIGGSYGSKVQARTQVRMNESETAADNHRQLSVDQSLAYQLRTVPVSHDLKFSEWERNSQDFARQAQATTTVMLPSQRFGIQAELDTLKIADQSHINSKLWSKLGNSQTTQPFQWETQFGVAWEGSDESLIQQHQAAWKNGNTTISLRYLQDISYEAMTAYDIFGEYARTHLTPYINEGFYQQEQDLSELNVILDHGSDWGSSISLMHNQQESELLHSENAAFMESAAMEATTLTYQIQALPYGSDLTLSHSQNRGNQAEFNTTGLTYAQAFSPFRMRDLKFIVELSVRNQPGVPSWWMLHDLPWDVAQTDTWYEGQLRVNF
jgi:hypothetical protein